MERRLGEMDKKKIREKVEELREKNPDCFGTSTKIGVLSRKLGFFVGQAKLAEGTEGVIQVDKTQPDLLKTGRNMVIIVDRRLDKVRQRFIIAHELGHYLLRTNPDDPVFARRESAHGRTDGENEADYFAACLLMPSDDFKRSIQKLCVDFNIANCEAMSDSDKHNLSDILSEQYKVEKEAALRRIGEVLMDES